MSMKDSPNVTEKVFGRLIEGDGRYRSVTMLSERLAVTVPETTDPKQGHAELIQILFNDDTRIPGRLKSTDSTFGLQIFELESPVPWNHPGILQDGRLSSSMMGTSLMWTDKGPFPVEGRITLEGDSGDAYFGLISSNGEYRDLNARFKGAPVIADGRLAGVITSHTNGRLYAVHAALLNRPIEREQNHPPVQTFEQIFSRLSISSKTAMAVAETARRIAEYPSIELPHLILGLSQKKELLDSLLTKAKVGLQVWDSAISQEGLTMPQFGSVVELQKLPPLSAEVKGALSVADQTAPGEVIEAPYVLRAALSVTTCELVQRLAQGGIRAEHVKLPHGPLPPPGDKKEPVAPSNAAAPPPEDTKEYTTRLQADGVDGVPLLGIEREVNALCSVLASKEAQAPLSVGLFGNWGSGKSFFMERMQKKFDAIQTVARARQDSPWCSNIVQVKFNAWHYIDTSLWANLTSEVFEQLSDELRKQSPQEPALKDKLMAMASGSRDALGEAERKRDSAQKALEVGEARLETLKGDALELENMTPADVLKEVYQEVVARPEVRAELNKVADDLKLPEVKKGTDEALAQLLELKGLAAWVLATWKSIRFSKGSWIWAPLLALAAVAGLAVLRSWLKELPIAEWLKTSTGVLTTGVAFLSPFLKKAKGIVAKIDEVRKGHEKNIQDKAEARRKEIETEKRKLRESVTLTTELVLKSKKALAEVEEQLDALRADREIFAFIQERHRSEDYTRHLGLIAKARGDFERLSALMAKLKEEDKTPANISKKRSAVPRVDRIVLYIDDLDRCPEKLVVEVLQAVHLLLAFPLFVVVVGVDPRWLLHSLRQHCVAFKGKPGELDKPTQEELDEWRTTPLNYLEKIFQIPFTLRPMTPTGFKELIDQWNATELAVQKAEPPPQDIKKPEEKPVDLSKTVDQDPPPKKKEKTPPAEEKPKDEAPKPPAPLPEPVPIGEAEWTAIKILGPLIPTPRAAKRFVNLYRLLRASMPAAERAAFLAGGYRGAQLLLAMVTGHPEVGSELVAEAIRKKPTGSWWTFAAGYRPVDGTNKDGLQSDATLVRALYKDFDVVEKEMGVLDCAAFQTWLEEIARYSFRSGRVLIDVAS